MTDLTDEDTPEEIAEERITNLMRELDECKAKLAARSAKSGDRTAEARDRLNRLCALPAKDVPCQADIRAALEEIGHLREALREIMGRCLASKGHEVGLHEARARLDAIFNTTRAALRGGEEHSKHPTGDYCVYCLSQWPCVEAGEQ